MQVWTSSPSHKPAAGCAKPSFPPCKWACSHLENQWCLWKYLAHNGSLDREFPASMFQVTSLRLTLFWSNTKKPLSNRLEATLCQSVLVFLSCWVSRRQISEDSCLEWLPKQRVLPGAHCGSACTSFPSPPLHQHANTPLKMSPVWPSNNGLAVKLINGLPSSSQHKRTLPVV